MSDTEFRPPLLASGTAFTARMSVALQALKRRKLSPTADAAMLAPSKRHRPRFGPKDIQALCEPIYLLADQRGLGGTGERDSAAAGGGGAAAGPDPVAPVLRAISSSRQRDAFVNTLSSYVAQKDAEIERVCRDNYGEFLASTEKLLRVRKGTANLQHTLATLNSEIQEKGAVLANAKMELLESNRVATNIDESVQTLQDCLRILDLANKINRLITVDKNYYAALRSLEDLLAIHIKPLLQFGFAQHMLTTLPLTKLQIRAEVTTEFKSWLYEARESGKELGKRAIEQYEKRARRWRERGVGSSLNNVSQEIQAALSQTPLNGPVEVGVSEKYEYNATLMEDQTMKINFKPLYQCILIYDTLGVLEDMQKSYQSDRSSQASLILSESQSIQPFSLDVLSQLLQEIVGFFIIESYVLNSTRTLSVKRKVPFRTQEQVGELWTMMSERLAHVISSGLAGTTDLEMHLAVKGKLLSTVQTLQGFGYSTGLLNEILAQFLRRYASLMSAKFERDFRQIIMEDENQAMLMDNEADLDRVLEATYLPREGPWSLLEIKQMPLPVELPFSHMFPLCCNDIRKVVAQFRQFSEGAVATVQERDELLREALDRLLISGIAERISEKIRETNNLPGLAQIASNLDFFVLAADQISSYVLMTMTPLEVGKYFRTALKQATVKIVSVVSRQLDGFFEDAQYDWLARRPPQASRDGEEEPSGFLLDMVNYLSLSMDNQLAGLASEHRNDVYKGALGHCATSLMTFLIDKNTSRISDNGLAHFAVDVRFMTALSSNLPGDVGEVFAELSQMIALIESDTPSDFIDRDVRQLAYPAVTVRKLQPALVKLITHLNSIDPMRLSQNEQKRKRELETVLRHVAAVRSPTEASK